MLVAEQNDFGSADEEGGVHMFAEREDFAHVELTVVLEFFTIKEHFEQTVTAATQSQTVRLMKVVTDLIVTIAKYLADDRVVGSVNFFFDPRGNFRCQRLLGFSLR